MKRIIIGLVLFALPAGVAQWAKRSDWGATQSAPQFRQKGSPKARLTIVEYSDFQCPSCAMIQPTVKTLLDAYPEKIRIVFKHNPLTSIHKNAYSAAIAAECAGIQGKFWLYHDRLFATQSQWATLRNATTMYASFANEIQLDAEIFNTCLSQPMTAEAIKSDVKEAKNRQVQSTPTFFIGETRLVGNYMVTDGARTIEKELRK